MTRICLKKCFKRVLLFLSLLGSSAVFAVADRSQNTLLKNGFNAAGVGDIWFDHGQTWDETYTALRLRAAFQLLRWGEFSMTAGYSKTGFYQALRQENADGKKIEIDYHGPSLEAILFPSRRWNLVAGGLINAKGHSRIDVARADLPVELVSSRAQAGLELGDEHRIRSRLSVREWHLAFSYEFWYRLHLILGGGMRTISHRYQYDNCSSETGDCLDRWPAEQRLDLEEENPFFFIGIRGSHL